MGACARTARRAPSDGRKTRLAAPAWDALETRDRAHGVRERLDHGHRAGRHRAHGQALALWRGQVQEPGGGGAAHPRRRDGDPGGSAPVPLKRLQLGAAGGRLAAGRGPVGGRQAGAGRGDGPQGRRLARGDAHPAFQFGHRRADDRLPGAGAVARRAGDERGRDRGDRAGARPVPGGAGGRGHRIPARHADGGDVASGLPYGSRGCFAGRPGPRHARIGETPRWGGRTR
jgi:hypothetical protein